MTFNPELRYRPYDDWTQEEIKKIQDNVAKSPWHTNYHIEPERGLLNDPNGVSAFNGQFTLFYQWFPFGAAHGLKSWVHLTSEDLVHFKKSGTVLYPDIEFDSHGAYSGSAYQVDDELFLFYTGNHRDENWIRFPYQIGATMDTKGNIKKFDKVLIQPASDATEHFRDPQIFDYNGQFYAIVGAQNHDQKGFIKLYKAIDNDVKNWIELGDLNYCAETSEYMEECPNLVFINQQPVLLYCPQGLNKDELNYDNIYPNTYIIGQKFNPETATIEQPSAIQNLDYGFEAYATQAFNAPDGRVLAISWLGLPDVSYPSDKYDYQGALSLVKELTLKDGKLYQYPVDAIKSLRGEVQEFKEKNQTSNCYELELTFNANEKNEIVLFSDELGNGFKLIVDTKIGKVNVDRSKAGEQYATEFGIQRECSITPGQVVANIFVDKSIIEIFINKGEKVFSSRVYPDANQTGIKIISGDVQGQYYELNYGC